MNTLLVDSAKTARLLLWFGLVLLCCGRLHAQTPDWWGTRNLLRSDFSGDDYSPVNQGQLKHMATDAALELNELLPGGAGDKIFNTIVSWQTPTSPRNDFAAVNLGQIKAVASLFHERLKQEGYTWVPWLNPIKPGVADDYAVANLGQMKAMFAFDLRRDVDEDGLPDWWEFKVFKEVLGAGSSLADYYDILNSVDQQTDLDEDGIPDVVEYRNGTDPLDYYNGIPPLLSLSGGNQQIKWMGSAFLSPFSVFVSDSTGKPLVNAPVKFWIESGDVYLEGFGGWTDNLQDVRTNTDGIAEVSLRAGDIPGVIRAEAVGSFNHFDFSEAARDPNDWKVKGEYFGKASVLPFGDNQWTGQDSSQLEKQTIGVRVLDFTGSRGVPQQLVRVQLISGDAVIETVSGEELFTDQEGNAQISVVRGASFSYVQMAVVGQIVKIGVDQRIPGAIEVLSSSMDGIEGRYPANSVPILYLSRALPLEVTVNSATGVFVRSGDNAQDQSAVVYVNYEQPVGDATGSLTTTRKRKEVTGHWIILPDRKSIAFIPDRGFYGFANYCEPDPRINVSTWIQATLTFDVTLKQGALFGAIQRTYEKTIALADSVDFNEALSKASPEQEYLLRLNRRPQTYVMEDGLQVIQAVPQDGVTEVSAGFTPLIKFSKPLHPDFLKLEHITIRDLRLGPVSCAFDFNYETNVLRITPLSSLMKNNSYSITVNAEVQSLAGSPLGSDFVTLFTTGGESALSGVPARYLKEGLAAAGSSAVAPDSAFSIYVDKGLPASFYDQSTAMLSATYYPDYVINLTRSYNPNTGRLIWVPEKPLAMGVAYEFHFDPKSGSGESGSQGDNPGQNQPPSGEDGQQEGSGGLTFRFETGSESASGSEFADLDLAGAGIGKGGPPGDQTKGGDNSEQSDAGAFDDKGEPVFNRDFRMAFVTGYGSGNQGFPRLVVSASDSTGEYSRQEWTPMKYEDLINNSLDPRAGCLTNPITLGSVIRVSADGGSGVSQSADSASLKNIRTIAVAGPPTHAVVDPNHKPSTVYFNYFCFNYEFNAQNYSVQFIDGHESVFPARGFSVGLPGNYVQARGEVVLCPVIVRDEDEGDFRDDDEFVLSTRIGDLKYAPQRPQFDSDERFTARVKAYFNVPYPKPCVALIKAKALGGDMRPVMPRLTACIKDAPDEVRGYWRLRVQYDRGNGRGERSSTSLGQFHSRTQPQDVIDIPGRPDRSRFPYDLNKKNVDNYSTWTELMQANQVWKIYETEMWKREIETLGLFGGDAKLFWYSEAKRGVPSVEYQVAHFRIGGENPSNGYGRFWLESRNYNEEENVEWAGRDSIGNDGKLWFAYAVAKTETAEYRYTSSGAASGASLFNQFRSNPKRADLGYPTWNNDGAKKPGGYGIFQVTGDSRDEVANIPRDQIWSWRQNMRAGGEILRGKWRGTSGQLRVYRDRSKAVFLNPLTVRGALFADATKRTMLDAMVMKRFNGASKPNVSDFVDLGDNGSGLVQGFRVSMPQNGDFCYWDDMDRAWRLSRYNSVVDIEELPDGKKKRHYKGFNYVDRVCVELDPVDRALTSN